MKKLEDEKDIKGQKLLEDDHFCFRCHKGLECFNLCCRNLNMVLYPYDVLRLKNRLGLTSVQFIEEHTEAVLRQGLYFPTLYLTMADNEEKTCPFLTEKGCGVYEDRPYACRTFPTQHAIWYDDSGQGDGEILNFFNPPDFCQGQKEPDKWTVEEWLKDQEAGPYFKWMRRWSDFQQYFTRDPWGIEGPEGNIGRMAFMATYNIDDFREFVFKSSFFKRFKVKSDLKRRIKKNDEELLKLGMDWVKRLIWGIPSKNLRTK